MLWAITAVPLVTVQYAACCCAGMHLAALVASEEGVLYHAMPHMPKRNISSASCSAM